MQPQSKTNPKVVEGITAIAVCGYKSLAEECEIEIRPLTILAGANSSGKSSIMQPLLMLKQTLEATYDPGALLIDGPNVRFNSVEQFLSKLDGKESADSLTIGVEIDGDLSLTNIFKKPPRKGIELVEMTYHDQGNSVTVWSGMLPGEIATMIPNQKFEQFPYEWGVERVRCFFAVTPYTSLSERYFIEMGSGLLIPINSFALHIRKLIHVPGLRGNPERTYKTTGIGSEYPGTFENYVASVINHWQETKDNRLSALGSALEMLGLTWKVESKRIDDTRTWKVESKRIDDTRIELRVGRTPHRTRGRARDMVSIADVGFGVSQVLPVLVALLVATPGQLVYLEQPEMHLHPRAQSALAEILADAAKRGVRVVAETHSSLLLLGVQTLVAEGKLSPELVKLHWFKRRNNGVTEVNSVDLDDAGAYGEWPTDFDDVELKAQSRYLDAAEPRLARG
ncbi:AAA family ATPase [Candidatus Poribacteria bacterium]|nr:AAA family ATPase [Candidatus Poribacteria bacterium]